VARSSEPKKNPRIRKSAPTIRERAQEARVKQETAKSGRTRRALSKASTSVKKLKISQRAPFKYLKKPLSWLKRALRWIIPSYFINSWRELRQVHWPNRKETWRLTLAVFIFAIIFGALVAGVDRALDEIFKKLVLK
jgi:preprotein translocase SecE subunit